ncbi:hypothetical protein JDN41_15320 [Rhodomicrobium udaipurense]|uniref:Uncharacterized protein n=2 Tax=Rhodomicrobium udaipurense TaxID=1202716 RepID=A0A8I1GD85_9HYPH|nr:hypothetical protein [Rhodomicrobium udaipurense]MBJ7544923.1 hypothetical protein [Rhodomicrobium udaipurense]
MTLPVRTPAMAMAIVAMSTFAHAEPAKVEGTVTDVLGQRLVVSGTDGKVLVDLGPEGKGQTAVKDGDKVLVEGDIKPDGQLKAANVTSNGQTYRLGEGKSWADWLLGRNDAEERPYTSADARKIATDKGFTLTSDPTPDKRHYVATATKDGKTWEIDIHRDGNIVEQTPFAVADAKRIATDKGFTLTSDLVAEKKHFTATATKNGKTYDIDIHRDGGIKDEVAFFASDARKLAADKGYQIVGEPQQEKKHFQMLARKDGKYYAIDAHRDGSVKELRNVDKSDIRWGPMIN